MRLPILAYCIVSLFFASACSSTASLDIMLKETDLGSVYLERSPARIPPAAHPIRIQPEVMTQILRGITAQEESGLLGKFAGSKSEPVRVFTEEQVQFLAPLLTEGLTKAASDQQIGFRLGPTRASTEIQQGTVYAYGRSLYVTLPWLSTVARYGAGGRPLAKTIGFTPESARRPDSYRTGPDSEALVIIDYELLALQPQIPALIPSPTPTVIPAPASSDQGKQGTDAQLRALQEQMRQKNEEVDGLKKELQDIRRQLTEPSTGTKRALPKSKSTQESR
ncbi:hypothetical protein [Nitrospira lenta]|uniref:Lipoprotein n=1 Tax=Nitrospira lenta TaxID=1436998 RepID=A0A0K2GX70_9BACT|nr:hypothetical protein [Nitrospira lenta]ALA66384.1 hypothetical protein NITLEN_v1_110040 [Nitrospira lenta]SPP64274.1 exported hypothetical protein [Nitrospira lenta]